MICSKQFHLVLISTYPVKEKNSWSHQRGRAIIIIQFWKHFLNRNFVNIQRPDTCTHTFRHKTYIHSYIPNDTCRTYTKQQKSCPFDVHTKSRHLDNYYYIKGILKNYIISIQYMYSYCRHFIHFILLSYSVSFVSGANRL